jgi:uncharacterized protein with HEPN domain
MEPSSPKYLEDIREAGCTIVEVTSGRTLVQYAADKVLRLAGERCFEIIGEALRRLEENDPGTASKISDYRRIIAFRNVLIHGYSLVKHDLVWSVVEGHLPRLLREVEGLLGREARSQD